MAIRTGSSRQPSRKSWSWSMEPLVTWIRILGINIPDISTTTTSRHRWFFIFYGTLCFLINVVCQIDIICFFNSKSVDNSSKGVDGVIDTTKTATYWNSFTDFTNYSVYSLGGHLVLLIVIQPRWAKMTQCFQRTSLIFNDENFTRLRHITVFGIGYVVTVVINFGNKIIKRNRLTHPLY